MSDLPMLPASKMRALRRHFPETCGLKRVDNRVQTGSIGVWRVIERSIQNVNVTIMSARKFTEKAAPCLLSSTLHHSGHHSGRALPCEAMASVWLSLPIC